MMALMKMNMLKSSLIGITPILAGKPVPPSANVILDLRMWSKAIL